MSAKQDLRYQEALERTSTAEAPWYVIPANRLWFHFPPEPNLPKDLVIT